MGNETGLAALAGAGERWNAGDLDGYLTLYDPDVALHGYQGVDAGIASVRRFYEAFWHAFPGSQLVFEDLFAADDRVACRFVLHATHKGELMGIPPTERAVTLPGITILRFAAGRCVERWSQADFLGLLQQLGAIPAPEQPVA